MAARTSGGFSCELRIKIESVVRSPRGRFERREDLSAVEFLEEEERNVRLNHRKKGIFFISVSRCETDVPVDGAEELMPLDLLHPVWSSSCNKHHHE